MYRNKNMIILDLIKIISIAMSCGLTGSVLADGFPSAVKINDTIVDTQAMTLSSGTYGYAINGLSFQQNLLVSHNAWQYAAYYNGAGHVCVARRQLPAGPWAIAELTDYTISTTGDAHNTISIGICPNDGTIHLSFDHHGGALHYRRSQTGAAANPEEIVWESSLFGPVQNYLISGKTISSVTYPRFWQTPGGDLQFGYRAGGSGNGDWYMADYTAATGLWSNVHQVINRYGSYTDSMGTSNVRNAYLNGPVEYGPDGKLHITWTWRESANHDIMYAYSNDGGNTWYNNMLPAEFRLGAGNTAQHTMLTFRWIHEGLQVIGNSLTGLLIRVDSPGVAVVPLDRKYGIMNQQAQAIDAQGRVHILMFHCTPESYAGYNYSTFGPVGARRYNHYWRDAQGHWIRNELPFDANDVHSYVGQRPKLFIRSNGDAYAICQAWRSTSLTHSGIYIHDGDLVIQAATEANHWADWRIIHVEQGPFLNEALADPYRFRDGILSVAMQESPSANGQSTPLRVLDFQLN